MVMVEKKTRKKLERTREREESARGEEERKMQQIFYVVCARMLTLYVELSTVRAPLTVILISTRKSMDITS